MRFYKYLLSFCIFCIAAASGCGKTPLVSNLTHNKLIVVLKGTYESNSPQPWAIPGPDDPLVQDDSVINAVMPGVDQLPGSFMLDISDMELLDMQGDRHKFSNLRQAYATSIDSNDLDPFFNGAGLILDNDDIPQKYYVALFIMARRMLFDNATKYNTQGAEPVNTATPVWNPQPFFDVFRELAVPGLNFNQYQPHAYYDTLRLENYVINRVFPIVIGVSGLPPLAMIKTDSPLPLVLEIRFVIKNFIKKYEIANSDNGIAGYVHFYSLSDWLHDIKADEYAFGGNLHSISRFYQLGQTGKISGTNTTLHAAHVIAIPAGSDITNYTIPNNNLRAANPCNLPSNPGLFYSDDISGYLDFLLRQEKFKNDWNEFFPIPQPPILPCASFDIYQTQWDNFAAQASSFAIPPLAVYAPAGAAYTIDTVSPGNYDVYISNVIPTYGRLYLDTQFDLVKQSVNVGIGQEVTVP